VLTRPVAGLLFQIDVSNLYGHLDLAVNQSCKVLPHSPGRGAEY
jgi:hypothetical protein